jgi:hypothetical protein
MKRFFLPLIIAIFFFSSCNTEPGNVAPFGSVTIDVSHFIEQKLLSFDTTNGHIPPPAQLKPLVFDSCIYKNEYGEQFSVSKLQYYLSNISFYNGSRMVYASNKVYYIDARATPNFLLKLDGVPMGNYTAVSYEIGLDAPKNIQGYLPSTTENINRSGLQVWVVVIIL